jgi:hypothetical protein
MANFTLKFWKKNKRTGTKIFEITNFDTYEDVLFEIVLNQICEFVYGNDYFYLFLNNHIFITEKTSNNFISTYEIHVYDERDWSKKIVDYCVEIECLLKLENEDILSKLRSY